MNLHNNTALNLIYHQKIFYISYIDLHSIFLHQLLLACYDLYLSHSALGNNIFILLLKYFLRNFLLGNISSNTSVFIYTAPQIPKSDSSIT